MLNFLQKSLIKKALRNPNIKENNPWFNYCSSEKGGNKCKNKGCWFTHYDDTQPWNGLFLDGKCYFQCVGASNGGCAKIHVCPFCDDPIDHVAFSKNETPRPFCTKTICVQQFKKLGFYTASSPSGLNVKPYIVKDEKSTKAELEAVKAELEAFKATAEANLKAVKAVSEAKLKAVEAMSEAKLDQAKFETEVAKKTLSNTKRRNGIQ